MDFSNKIKKILGLTQEQPLPPVEPYPITDRSFLDVHHVYDKNDFIFSWKKLLDSNQELWQQALTHRNPSKKILAVTLGAGFSHRYIMAFDTTLSIALTLRGATVETLSCDHAFPICLKAEYSYIKPEVMHHSQISQTLCKGCYKDSALLDLQTDLTTHYLNNFVTIDDRNNARYIATNVHIDEIKNYEFQGTPIGKYVIAGTVRYYAHSDPASQVLGVEILRKYLEAAMIAYYGINRVLDENHYDSVFMCTGLFIPQGIIKEVCERRGIPIINWVMSNMRERFQFTRGGILDYMLYEPNVNWENFKWGDAQEREITNYLNTRWDNTQDWATIPKDDKRVPFDDFARENNIDLNKPIIGLLTNIIWESFAEYKSKCFPDMLTWIYVTIKYFKKRPDLQLLIRIHPAERIWNASRQFVIDEVTKMFPVLPANVFIIDSTQNVNTYEAMFRCDAALIYQTQTGVELAAMEGIPVIVAGEAWIRHKGIAHEPKSEQEYYDLLDQLPFKKRLPEATIKRARKYAYHTYYRAMIPVYYFEETKDWNLFKPTFKTLDELLPNNDAGFDIICNGILNGAEFIFPAEEFGAHILKKSTSTPANVNEVLSEEVC